jgi:hypothetical protein
MVGLSVSVMVLVKLVSTKTFTLHCAERESNNGDDDGHS